MKIGVLDNSIAADWQKGKKSQQFATIFSFVVILLAFLYSVTVLIQGPYV
jgi:hypothetical protein